MIAITARKCLTVPGRAERRGRVSAFRRTARRAFTKRHAPPGSP